jgi:DNA-binding response OmpR family regulator
VLVLTEDKGVHDEVRCLESGADDYLRKPFFPSQLLARIHALSREAALLFHNAPPPSSQLALFVLIRCIMKLVSMARFLA